MRVPWCSGLRGGPAWSRKASFLFLLKSCWRWAPLLLWLLPMGTADIKGSGTINFDSDANGSAEAALTTTGLGIGTATPSTNLQVLGNAAVSNNLGIGTTAPGSSLDISGTWGLNYQTVSANTVLSGNSVVLANTGSDNILVDLPYSGNTFGRVYYIKKTSNINKLWVTGGGNYIDDLGSVEVSTSTQGLPFISVVSDGQKWQITGRSSDGTGSVASGNLVGWWKLDETSGTSAADSSGSNLSGTLTNMDGASDWVAGKIGKALDFDGQNDYVTMGTSSVLNPSYITVSAWFKYSASNSVSGGNVIVSHWTSGSNYPYILYMDSGTMKYAITNAAVSNAITTGSAVSSGNWHHAALVYDGSLVRGYLNGNLDGTPTAQTGAIQTLATSTIIGSRDSGSFSFFNGVIDDVRIYNRALTAAEVQALYSLGH